MRNTRITSRILVERDTNAPKPAGDYMFSRGDRFSFASIRLDLIIGIKQRVSVLMLDSTLILRLSDRLRDALRCLSN